MTSLVYILFQQQNERDPIGVYSTHEIAQRQAFALGLKNWYILSREYI